MLSSKSLKKISFKDDTPTPQQNSAPPAGVSQKSKKTEQWTGCDLAVKMKRGGGGMYTRLKMEVCTHFSSGSNNLRQTLESMSSPFLISMM